jgi:dolichol-phosphate mannosyltransferase
MSSERFDASISVVLPAFNEEDNIQRAVGECLAFLPTRFRDYEVIVVDDGSRDGTAEAVSRLQASEPKLKLLRHPTNLGYGRAIATGFAAARSELVFYTDSDCQFDVREIADLMPLLAQADAVLGFRVYRYDSVLRCILSWVYNRLVRVLFLIRVRDVDCAFKLFRREVVERMPLESNDFFVDTEMVARLARMKARVVEKGVRHYPRTAGHTTVRASHIPRTLWTVGRMWFRLHFGAARVPAPAERSAE